ncbi:MFS transporter [archaeon]|nr:MFS transporter [archaeon]
MREGGKRSLWSFSLASFFNDLGSDMVAPIWPIFLTSILGANVALLGLIDGIAIAVVAVSKGLAGWWSDRAGKRKPFIVAGYSFSGLSRLGYYLSPSYWAVIPFKVLDRFGKIRGAPRDAMMAEITTKKERGRSFGLLRSMDTLGALVGTLVTLLIINILTIRNILLLAVIPSFISVIIIYFFVEERRGRSVFKGFSLEMKPLLRNFLILMSFFVFFSVTYSFLIVFARDAGLGTQDTTLMYLLLNIVYFIAAYQFGRLSDKVSRFKVMIIGVGLFALTCVAALMGSILSMFLLFGLYLAVFDPVQKTIVSELAPKNRRGGIIGTFQMITGLVAIPGGLFMGLLYDFNPVYPFIIGLASSLIIALFMLKLKK